MAKPTNRPLVPFGAYSSKKIAKEAMENFGITGEIVPSTRAVTEVPAERNTSFPPSLDQRGLHNEAGFAIKGVV